jgi:hypothetical protein
VKTSAHLSGRRTFQGKRFVDRVFAERITKRGSSEKILYLLTDVESVLLIIIIMIAV